MLKILFLKNSKRHILGLNLLSTVEMISQLSGLLNFDYIYDTNLSRETNVRRGVNQRGYNDDDDDFGVNIFRETLTNSHWWKWNIHDIFCKQFFGIITKLTFAFRPAFKPISHGNEPDFWSCFILFEPKFKRLSRKYYMWKQNQLICLLNGSID